MNHLPVLLKEVIKYLNPQSGENFIDATVGDGGHSLEIIKHTSPNGKVLGIDWDPTSLQHLSELCGTSLISSEEVIGSRLDTGSNAWESEPPRADSRSGIEPRSYQSLRSRLVLRQGNFSEIADIASRSGFGKVDGVLFDFGFSSYHIDESGRGFSYLKNEPLDMRYHITRTDADYTRINPSTSLGAGADQTRTNADNSLTAEEIVNKWSEKELERIFREFGEERNARKIAKAIVSARARGKIKTTGELVGIIDRTYPASPRLRRASKTYSRIFQALRIAVNNELENIKMGLDGAWQILKPGGRLAAISFHSLEDRIVKNFFKEKEKAEAAEILTKKPVTPSDSEIENNSRSRSAKLRAIRKL